MVTIDTVKAMSAKRTISVVGSLYGKDELGIMPEVEGRLVSLHKDVGDIVRGGELLAVIDEADYQLAVSEAERALEAELSRLGLKSLPTAHSTLKSCRQWFARPHNCAMQRLAGNAL